MQEIQRRIMRPALLGALTLGTALAQSPPPAPDPTKAQDRSEQPQTGHQQPVEQQDAVHPRNSKEDVEAVGNRKMGKGPNFYSLEKEIALAKQLAQEVERSAKLIDDPVVTEYVNRVGQNLVRNSDARVPFTIKVIDSDEVNAFALPGGFFYVNSGLILRAQEESELAGVMAHEISHVTARHGTKNATRGQILQLATIPLLLLGPAGLAGYGLYEGLNVALPLTYLKFSRDSPLAFYQLPLKQGATASRICSRAARPPGHHREGVFDPSPDAGTHRTRAERNCAHFAESAGIHRHDFGI